MMGAVLHTINVRLAPEQRLFTINHAEDDLILVNAEFHPMLEQIKDQLTTVRQFILINDEDTGSPKGVYFSHRQLVLHTLAGLAALGTSNIQGRFHKEDVYMPITPMFHVHAWGIPYIATTIGLKQVYPGRSTACPKPVRS